VAVIEVFLFRDVPDDMLHLLETREKGSTKPISIVRRETARRSLALQLSKYQDAELFHNAGVNTLDIDLIEQR
jgi:hypothetical protein